MTDKTFVDIDNARIDEQRQVMRKIIAANECPFCQENLTKYHKKPIIKKGKYWLVTTNQWPYSHTKFHFMLIATEHVEKLAELAPEAGAELIELTSWLEKEYQFPGGGLALRFGNTNYSAGSVAHLHVQVVVPDLDDPEFEPTRIKIGNKPQTT